MSATVTPIIVTAEQMAQSNKTHILGPTACKEGEETQQTVSLSSPHLDHNWQPCSSSCRACNRAMRATSQLAQDYLLKRQNKLYNTLC